MEVKCGFFPKKREKGIMSVLNWCENLSGIWEHFSFLSFNGNYTRGLPTNIVTKNKDFLREN